MNTIPPSHWSVGQKVICIDDRFPPAIIDWCDHLPIAGHVYTIRAIQAGHDSFTGRSNLGFLLVEIVNPKSAWGCEAGFCHYRFVPWLDVASETERQNAGEPLQLQNTQ
ncbi:MAG: hypothetical protein FJ395_19985 [Verrucomicrobia bacterium]|nr:hypothetical protein [Verrucomicrobiota bacterium]